MFPASTETKQVGQMDIGCGAAKCTPPHFLFLVLFLFLFLSNFFCILYLSYTTSSLTIATMMTTTTTARGGGSLVRPSPFFQFFLIYFLYQLSTVHRHPDRYHKHPNAAPTPRTALQRPAQGTTNPRGAPKTRVAPTTPTTVRWRHTAPSPKTACQRPERCGNDPHSTHHAHYKAQAPPQCTMPTSPPASLPITGNRHDE
jgi:hypothetical protein